ncbi:MAG: 30S ribosomal protein S2 [Elusimicrobia bacterium RIFOXYB2_FULL_49_7]|nr:MAG: 30S ribosomal protein S2 [Elusimicrobia bacterium RIFOXYB2_FULL_49_7]
MAELTLQSLLEAGAHFGHQTSRWNPQMRRYILTAKNGIHLINLEETLTCVQAAAQKLAQVQENGRSILFVGTKNQAKDAVREAAEKCKQCYVNVRWLGGLLTNYSTIKKSLKKVDDIDRMEQDGTFKLLPKKEVNRLRKKRERILNFLAGVKEMKGLPGAVVIVDILKEHISLLEARRLKIPVIGILDTNADPTKVEFPIPANDDSLKTVQLILDSLADVIAATPIKVVQRDNKDDEGDGRRRIVKRKIIKTIVRKKRLKGSGEAAEETSVSDAAASSESVSHE